MDLTQILTDCEILSRTRNQFSDEEIEFKSCTQCGSLMFKVSQKSFNILNK